MLTEETDWVGGQLTAQAVPPDEHPWIERFGCTALYRELRDGVRAYYRTWYPLTAAAAKWRALNPGAGWVSKLCHEPRVALAVLDGLLARTGPPAGSPCCSSTGPAASASTGTTSARSSCARGRGSS